MLGKLEGRLQIPGHIHTSIFAVRSAVDALYVQRMHRYLAGLADKLEIPTCIILLEVPALNRRPGEKQPPS